MQILIGTFDPSLIRPEWIPAFWLLSTVLNTSAEGHCNGGAGSQITPLNVWELPQPSHFLFIVANSLLFVMLYKTRFRLKAKGVMRFRLRYNIFAQSSELKR